VVTINDKNIGHIGFFLIVIGAFLFIYTLLIITYHFDTIFQKSINEMEKNGHTFEKMVIFSIVFIIIGNLLLINPKRFKDSKNPIKLRDINFNIYRNVIGIFILIIIGLDIYFLYKIIYGETIFLFMFLNIGVIFMFLMLYYTLSNDFEYRNRKFLFIQ